MAITNLAQRQLRAVGDKVVVQKAKRPERTRGGIIMPDEDVRVYTEGLVVSVGPDVKSCKVGDEVVWKVFTGQAAGHHDEARWIIADAEVLAVLEPDPPLTLPASVPAELAKELVPGATYADLDSSVRPTPKVR